MMKKENCLFCKIANGEIPSHTLYEDEYFRAILDVNPATKGHTLLLSKDHFQDLFDLDRRIEKKILPLAKVLGEYLKQSLDCNGIHLVQNNGKAAGQTVFHFHMHLIPRYKGDEEMITWNPKPVDEEELADVLKKIKEVKNIGQEPRR